ncbi:MAG: NUDIX hydrolase [Actinomycetales bacterium]|nr:NUDIX hydrolase [Actinomycetales bacterium]
MSDRKFSRPRRRVLETSAGGFVLAADGSNRVALIGRLSRSGRIDWCVPKGHPEGEETLEQAAVREVYEETGLEVEILHPLGQIQYEFSAGPKLIAKTVHHYLFRQTGGDLTVEGDPDQEAVEARWFELEILLSSLAHENERRIARGVIEWVENQA